MRRDPFGRPRPTTPGDRLLTVVSVCVLVLAITYLLFGS